MSDQERTLATTCKANSCPLRVTHITDWWEVEKRGDRRAPKWGVCDFHHEADGSEWTAVTKRILANHKALQIMHAVKGINDPAYKPLMHEAVGDWLQRVDVMTRALILPERQRADLKPGAFDSVLRLINQGSVEVNNR